MLKLIAFNFYIYVSHYINFILIWVLCSYDQVVLQWVTILGFQCSVLLGSLKELFKMVINFRCNCFPEACCQITGLIYTQNFVSIHAQVFGTKKTFMGYVKTADFNFNIQSYVQILMPDFCAVAVLVMSAVDLIRGISWQRLHLI